LKNLIVFGGLTVLGWKLFKGSNLKQFISKFKSAANVGTNLIIDIADFNLVNRSFNLVLINQTKDILEVTQPGVELFVDDQSVAYSQPSERKYQINPLSKTKIRIKLTIRQSSLFQFTSLIRKLKTAHKFVKYSLYANGIFYKGEKQL